MKNAWPSLRQLDDALSAWGAECPADQLWITGRTWHARGEAARALDRLPRDAPVMVRAWGDALWNVPEWLSWEPALLGRPVVFVASCQAHARLLRLLMDAAVVVAPYPLGELPPASQTREAWLAGHGISPTAPTVLYLGRKTALKGLVQAWQAWRTLREVDSRTVFIQVGRWEENFPQARVELGVDQLKVQAGRLAHLAEGCWYDFPECDRAGARQWLEAADLVVCPSVYPEEDGALTAREALALGRKVLATAWGAHLDLSAAWRAPLIPAEAAARPVPTSWDLLAREAWASPPRAPWALSGPSAPETVAHARPFGGFTPWARLLGHRQAQRGQGWLMADGAWDPELWFPWRDSYMGGE
jgi:hypothetical protein